MTTFIVQVSTALVQMFNDIAWTVLGSYRHRVATTRISTLKTRWCKVVVGGLCRHEGIEVVAMVASSTHTLRLHRYGLYAKGSTAPAAEVWTACRDIRRQTEICSGGAGLCASRSSSERRSITPHHAQCSLTVLEYENHAVARGVLPVIHMCHCHGFVDTVAKNLCCRGGGFSVDSERDSKESNKLLRNGLHLPAMLGPSLPVCHGGQGRGCISRRGDRRVSTNVGAEDTLRSHKDVLSRCVTSGSLTPPAQRAQPANLPS